MASQINQETQKDVNNIDEELRTMASQINLESPRGDVNNIDEEDFSDIPTLAIRPPIIGPMRTNVEGPVVQRETNQAGEPQTDQQQQQASK